MSLTDGMTPEQRARVDEAEAALHRGDISLEEALQRTMNAAAEAGTVNAIVDPETGQTMYSLVEEEKHDG